MDFSVKIKKQKSGDLDKLAYQALVMALLEELRREREKKKAPSPRIRRRKRERAEAGTGGGPPGVPDNWIENLISAPAGHRDAAQAIKAAFVPQGAGLDELATETVGAASGQHGTHLDWEQLTKDAFDETTERFKVVEV